MHVLAVICVVVPILFLVVYVLGMMITDWKTLVFMLAVIVVMAMFLWGVTYLDNEKPSPPQTEKAAP